MAVSIEYGALHTVNIYGFKFVSEDDIGKVVKEIFNYKEIGLAPDVLPLVVTPNVDQIVKLEDYPDLKAFLNKAYMVTPDGQPIVWSSRMLGKPLSKRITGADLFEPLWLAMSAHKSRVMCVTPSDRVSQKLKNDYAGGHYYTAPYFRMDEVNLYHRMIANIVDLIKKERIEFLFIGISFPKREYIAKSLIDELGDEAPLMLLFGAAFEFYLGEKKRAPLIMRRLGSEWFYRFLSEPKRLFRRYFVDSWQFIHIFLREKKGR